MTDWTHGDTATNDYFRPLETYAERFDAMLAEIQALGFEAIDVWLSHLNYTWASDDHLAAAVEALRRRGLSVASVGGWLGSTPAEFERSCQIALALGTRILGSSTSMLRKDRAFVLATLRRNGLRLGIENHPGEKTPADVLAQIGADTDVLGACVDTGWWGSQGYDAARAIEELGSHLVHIHLKDVRAPGAHETCRYGQGCVPVEGCVRALQHLAYAGGISIEHEPAHFDPTADIRANLLMLRGWLQEAQP
jgi:sugar phosphate isomerase/epimerase